MDRVVDIVLLLLLRLIKLVLDEFFHVVGVVDELHHICCPRGGLDESLTVTAAPLSSTNILRALGGAVHLSGAWILPSLPNIHSCCFGFCVFST